MTSAAKLLLVLAVVLAVLGLVLNGLASTIAWILFVLVIVFMIGPSLSPRSSWEGPYRDRQLH